MTYADLVKQQGGKSALMAPDGKSLVWCSNKEESDKYIQQGYVLYDGRDIPEIGLFNSSVTEISWGEDTTPIEQGTTLSVSATQSAQPAQPLSSQPNQPTQEIQPQYSSKIEHIDSVIDDSGNSISVTDLINQAKTSLLSEYEETNNTYNKILNQHQATQQSYTSLPTNTKNMSNLQSFDNTAQNGNDTDIVSQITNYRESYTDTCFRRTAPYGGTMPTSYERWLRAVDLACGKQNKRVKVDVVSALYAQVEKETASTYSNLCRMTAEPFPLVTSGKASNSSTTTAVQQQPLLDQQNGKNTASRYARICLSGLGQLATKWYHGTKMQDIKVHKSIVPLSLLRKTQAWTLGFRTEMRSLNPNELFYLMYMMLIYNTKYLDESILQQVFRGPDLGTGYKIYMTNDSLESLYACGKASITVVPEIEVDRIRKLIIFKRPVLDQTTNKLALLFNRRLRKKIEDEKLYNPSEIALYQTFSIDVKNGNPIKPNGSSCYIKVSNFIGTDEQIVAELESDPDIYKTVSLTNTILLPYDGTETNISKYEGIHYKCELMSVMDTLWMHINWERDNVRNYYTILLKDLKEELKMAKLLDKVTRPMVANTIHALMKQSDRREILRLIFSKDPAERAQAAQYNQAVFKGQIPSDLMELQLIRDYLVTQASRDSESRMEYWNEDEDFTEEEVSEIFRETGKTVLGDETINILSILFMRNKYRNRWLNYEAQIAEVERILSTSTNIDAEIVKYLENYINKDEYKRKSRVFFLYQDSREVEKKKRKEQRILKNMTGISVNTNWNKVQQPVSLYYSESTMFLSYGVNMNIYQKIHLTTNNNKPARVLNCLNTEPVAILHGSTAALSVFTPNQLNFTPYTFEHIRGIIPYDIKRKIMLLTNKKDTDGRLMSELRLIDWADIQRYADSIFDPTETIASWTYITDENGNYFDTEKTAINVLCSITMEDKDEPFIRRYTLNYILKQINESDDSSFKLPSTGGGIANDIVLTQTDSNYVPAALFWVTDYSMIDISNPTEGQVIPLNTGVFPYSFSTNIEFYVGRLYIEEWKPYHIIQTDPMYLHFKKGIIRETRFIYRPEAQSIVARRDLLNELEKSKTSIHIVAARSTLSYNLWQLSDTYDWSFIDKRFGFPDLRPTDENTLLKCNELYNKMLYYPNKVHEIPKKVLINNKLPFEQLKDKTEEELQNRKITIIESPLLLSTQEKKKVKEKEYIEDEDYNKYGVDTLTESEEKLLDKIDTTPHKSEPETTTKQDEEIGKKDLADLFIKEEETNQ